MSEQNNQNSTETNSNNSESNTNVSELEQAKLDLEKAKNDYLYLRADFDNFRKQVIKERSELMKYGSERVFQSFLDILDNFERALQVELSPETLSKFKSGLDLNVAEFRKVFEKFGVSEIATEGVAFDPSIHEALSAEESDATPAGHVLRVFKKAYKLHDRVLRPAQVVVAKEKSDA